MEIDNTTEYMDVIDIIERNYSNLRELKFTTRIDEWVGKSLFGIIVDKHI